MEGVPSKWRSSGRGIAGGGVLSEQTGLLESPAADSSSGLVTLTVAGAVLPCHSAATNASSIWQRGMPVEMHQGSNFTDSAKLVIENTSWKVWSPSWAILAHSCSCLLSILICLALYLWSIFWASLLFSLSSWALAWLKYCRHWRLGYSPISLPSECLLLGKEGGVGEGIDSDMGLERWHGSLEHFHRTSLERGYVLYPLFPSSQGKSTSVLEYGSSFHRHRQFGGNWLGKAPLGRSFTLR